MAYFAQIDNENIVTQVVIADTIDWVNENIGGNWIETSLDGSIRYNYAAIGWKYDSVRDAFIPPRRQCHTEITFNEDTCLWDCSNAEHNLEITND